jgi:NAD(P)-dependent dehydrogenase (short-subunit alcohol dehydrogenase family)
MLLDGKTALITGAGRGIGRGIALAFAREGCDVALSARSVGELDETARMARALGRRAVVLPCDVSDAEAVARMVDDALDALSWIDILVNNAGYACFKSFEDLSIEEWERTVAVNLNGPFYVTRALLPSMKARSSGRIINISSVSGLKPIVDQSAYCAAKHGLNGLTKCLALELREYGIGVHAICPGGVDTQLARENMGHRDMSDWMTPEDIAHTALYLATLPPRATTDILHIRRFGSEPL